MRTLATALTFDDVVLVPQHSTIKSRKEPNVSIDLGSIKLEIPIIASPMNTITEHQMMSAMCGLGGSAVLHRYMSSDEQLQQCIKAISNGGKNFFVAIGATGDFLDRAYRLYDTLGIRNFCIDVANGHSEICLNAVDALQKKIPGPTIMAGNVCSYSGAFRLADVGVELIRVGIGPGSMCKTRVVTGHGVPQITAIEDCARIKETFPSTYLIADGGIRSSGDIIKALAVGADAVMLGGLLAGTDETPGPVIDNGQINYVGVVPWKPGKFKKYAGMASEDGRKFNGWFTDDDASFIPEGESVEVPHRGSVKNVIDNLVGGLRVGMSYAGAHTIAELQENAEFIRVTENGRIEGTPHGK